jgi:hypothetical protein
VRTTIAARFDEATMAQLEAVSQLEGTSIVEQIRQAVAAFLDAKIASGELAAKAKEAISAIDADANTRRAAIDSLIGKAKPTIASAAPGGGTTKGTRGTARRR